MRAIHLIYPVIITSPLKNKKMINLSHKISIFNFIFTILFYAMRWKKQDHIYVCFEEFLNKKPFESKFQFSAA
jgi:hypothetical protein